MQKLSFPSYAKKKRADFQNYSPEITSPALGTLRLIARKMLYVRNVSLCLQSLRVDLHTSFLKMPQLITISLFRPLCMIYHSDLVYSNY